MRGSRFMALAAVLAAVAVGAFASSASALTITPTPTQTDTIATSLGRFSWVNAATGQALGCNILLVVRFDTGPITFAAPLTRIGAVNGGGAANCEVLTVPATRFAVILEGFPWTIATTAASTAANRLMTILGMQYRIGACTFRGDIGFVPNAAGNPVNLIRVLAGTFITTAACGGSMAAAAGQGFGLSVPITPGFV